MGAGIPAPIRRFWMRKYLGSNRPHKFKRRYPGYPNNRSGFAIVWSAIHFRNSWTIFAGSVWWFDGWTLTEGNEESPREVKIRGMTIGEARRTLINWVYRRGEELDLEN